MVAKRRVSSPTSPSVAKRRFVVTLAEIALCWWIAIRVHQRHLRLMGRFEGTSVDRFANLYFNDRGAPLPAEKVPGEYYLQISAGRFMEYATALLYAPHGFVVEFDLEGDELKGVRLPGQICQVAGEHAPLAKTR